MRKLLLSIVILLSLSACNKEPADIAKMPADYDLKSAQSSLPQSKGSPAQKASTLEEAIRTDDKDAIVYFLKQKKADPNQKTEQGEPLLNLAARRGFAFAVEQLLTTGANVNVASEYGYTPLMEASDIEIVRLLLSAGASLDVHTDDEGFTPLIWAAYNWAERNYGSLEKVKLLLKAGADVNGTDNAKDTALSLVIKEGKKENLPEIVSLLLSFKADVNTKNDEGNTPLVESCLRGLEEITDLLFANGANDSITAAVLRGDSNAVIDFIKTGTDVNTIRLRWNDAAGDYEQYTLLTDAIIKGHITIVQELIKAGANINFIPMYVEPALIEAVKSGRKEIVKLLIDAGANVNIHRESADTALKLAQKAGNEEIIKLLKAAGAKE